ncbi:serum paraoxonase/arylesterase 1-like [Saccostrea echinata]|uniref:serum paraoxonase/arylesterase 1-like n=1 Tax=Saccostrea echinata TaxID=191078 RepID=UPI002A7FE2C6|nr:serum paraoxonase/arylesterase 1-like [Saccostrea echinata]
MAVIKLVIFVLTTVLVAVIMQRIVVVWDVLRSTVIAIHAPGPCIELEDADGGSGDLSVLPDGRVFISSGFFPGSRGKLLFTDFLDPTHAVRELQIQGNINVSEAHFHGLSLWLNKEKGTMTIAVVNHPTSGQDTIEFFNFDEKKQTLIHTKTVKDPLFSSLNDIVLVQENQFYVTCSQKWTRLELFLHIKMGEVLFYDGIKVKVVAGGHLFANGINVSPDQRFVYVAELLEKKISVYERKSDNSIELKQSKYLDTGVSNIEVDPHTGDLWVGAHPRISTLVSYMWKEGQGMVSPSQVLKIKAENGILEDVIEVYLDDGGELTASSVAAFFKNRLIIGSLASNLLLCDVKYSK